MVIKQYWIWLLIRTLTFWIIGIRHTILIDADLVGTWKYYAGIGVLVLAFIDTFNFLKKIAKSGIGQSQYFKILAITLPFYFLFFPQLHSDPENPETRVLVKYTLVGLLIYTLGMMVYFTVM